MTSSFHPSISHEVMGLDAMIFSSVQSLSRVWLFATTWTAARQASLSITNSWSLFKLMSIELVMPFNHLILCLPFSFCLQSFPASGSFLMSQLFQSDDQNTGAMILVFLIFSFKLALSLSPFTLIKRLFSFSSLFLVPQGLTAIKIMSQVAMHVTCDTNSWILAHYPTDTHTHTHNFHPL